MLWVFFIFLWSAPVAFRRVALETPEWTSRDSNHHRQSVSAGKTNAIPTEPSGRLVEALAEAFEGTLRKLRRLRRHLKGLRSLPQRTFKFNFSSSPLRYLPEGPLTDCLLAVHVAFKFCIQCDRVSDDRSTASMQACKRSAARAVNLAGVATNCI